LRVSSPNIGWAAHPAAFLQSIRSIPLTIFCRCSHTAFSSRTARTPLPATNRQRFCPKIPGS
jgi:hypothetical protein